jgi:hypothetical protein
LEVTTLKAIVRFDDGKTQAESRPDSSFESFVGSVRAEGIFSEDRKTFYPPNRIVEVKDVTPEGALPFRALSYEWQEAMDRLRHRELHPED